MAEHNEYGTVSTYRTAFSEWFKNQSDATQKGTIAQLQAVMRNPPEAKPDVVIDENTVSAEAEAMHEVSRLIWQEYGSDLPLLAHSEIAQNLFNALYALDLLLEVHKKHCEQIL